MLVTRIIGLVLAAVPVLSHTAHCAEETQYPSYPKVIEMAVPSYPPVCKVARIEGTARFRVQTDGSKIIRVISSQGPPLLIRDLGRFIDTWRFEAHTPLQFEITFKMKVSPESLCPPGKPDEIKLILPTYVEMMGYPSKECDPVITKVVLTSRSSRTPPALSFAPSQHFAFPAPLIATVQAGPLSFIR